MILTPLFAAAALASGPASIGVGIQGNPVCLAVTAQPGHSYPLGNVYVENKGSGDEQIGVQAEPVWKGQRLYGRDLAIPPSWVSVSYPRLLWVIGQGSVEVAPGQGAYLPVTLDVPPDAKRGMYAGNLVAGTGTLPAPHGGAQAVFGAQAATYLEFGVGVAPPSCDPPLPSPAVIAASRRARAAGQFSAAPPAKHGSNVIGWGILAVIGVALLAIIRRVLRGR